MSPKTNVICEGWRNKQDSSTEIVTVGLDSGLSDPFNAGPLPLVIDVGL